MILSGPRQSLSLNQEQIDDLKQNFKTLTENGGGYINLSELGEAFQVVGLRLPNYEVRNLILEHDSLIQNDRVGFEDFQMLYKKLAAKNAHGRDWGEQIKRRVDVLVHGGMSESSVVGTTHTVSKAEQVAFTNWINKNVYADADCKKYLPLDPESDDLYLKTADGIIYCKLINESVPDTIDERVINKGKLSVYQTFENLTLALNSAQAIGCNIVNIGAEDLKVGKPHLVLGLLWQIIRIGLFSDINLSEQPNLAVLMVEGETVEEFRRLSPEQVLVRWVNYHLARSSCGRQISNFQGDIKDSIVYTHLLHQIAPREAGVTTEPEGVKDLEQRAEAMLKESNKIGCRSFVSPKDVVTGNYKLNLAFVANLFNNHPALEEPAEGLDINDIQGETREMKMYRNWMNSMGVSPYVNYLFSDLTDGLVILQLYDIGKPGIVDWSKVTKDFNKMRKFMEKISNCNYAVSIGKQSRFSLVGIEGKDIYDGNPTLTLALVWQMMKAYTISILTKLAGGKENANPISDQEIVLWANHKLKSSGKQRQISGFNDPSISNGIVIIDLIDAIRKGSVNYDLVKEGTNEQECLENAKFAVSMARKIGAKVYALPEDIVEVISKMVMTVFACLMIRDLQGTTRK